MNAPFYLNIDFHEDFMSGLLCSHVKSIYCRNIQVLQTLKCHIHPMIPHCAYLTCEHFHMLNKMFYPPPCCVCVVILLVLFAFNTSVFFYSCNNHAEVI